MYRSHRQSRGKLIRPTFFVFCEGETEEAYICFLYFLLYDLDVPEMLSKLQSIKNTILLVSNLCIELWFILHTCNHKATVASVQCIGQLERICRDYKKGSISYRLKNKLLTGEDSACTRAKKLPLYENPSTNVYKLIEALKSIY